jgi:23S rRNA pseudouridine955/2504/2580 synthase
VSKPKNFKQWIEFEDDNYLVINKPPNISTLSDRTGAVSVLELATNYFFGCQLCHRLDKETSGALLLSKHTDAYKHGNSQFADRSIEKIYHAVADGLHELKDLMIEKPLHISASGMVKVSKSGKPSATIATTLKKYKQHSLVECKPVTGRMHQIRVHMASIGAPLVGDETYGGQQLFLSSIKRGYRPKPEIEERPIMARVALHAYSLRFVGLDSETHHIECPYPKDYQTVLKQLGKNS